MSIMYVCIKNTFICTLHMLCVLLRWSKEKVQLNKFYKNTARVNEVRFGAGILIFMLIAVYTNNNNKKQW